MTIESCINEWHPFNTIYVYNIIIIYYNVILLLPGLGKAEIETWKNHNLFTCLFRSSCFSLSNKYTLHLESENDMRYIHRFWSEFGRKQKMPHDTKKNSYHYISADVNHEIYLIYLAFNIFNCISALPLPSLHQWWRIVMIKLTTHSAFICRHIYYFSSINIYYNM